MTSPKYEYSLRGGSRKDICPACGKKTFTPYVNHCGEVLSPEVGICDRKDKCNYHYPPSEYRRDHGLSVNHFIPRLKRGWVSGSNSHCRKVVRYQAPDYIPAEIFRKTMERVCPDALTVFLKNFFGRYGMVEALESVLSLYCVAGSRKYGGSPIFWLIDESGKVRDGKIMAYDASSGKRIRHPYPKITHVHSILQSDDGSSGGDYHGCMFGSHIVRTDVYKGQPLWVFESEKAAVIVATFLWYGGCMLGIPVAAGGCGALNPAASNLRDPYHRIRLLKGRKVVLFPDEGKFGEWSEKAKALRGFAGEVYVSSVMERKQGAGDTGVDIQPGDALDDLLMHTLESGGDVYGLLTRLY